MRSWRRRHVLASVVITAVIGGQTVLGQPSPPGADDQLAEPPRRPTAEPTVSQPGGVPAYTAGPPRIAVTPFENHVTNGKSLEWIVAGAPFEIAAKAENVLDLEAALAPLYVPGERVPPESDTIAAFAAKTGATFVVTGWFDRLGENLRIAVLVWKADRLMARVVGEAQRQAPPAQFHRTLGEASAEAWREAGFAIDQARTDRLSRALSSDIYPVFMLGRGLGHFTGALAAMNPVFGSGLGSGSAASGPDLAAAEHDLERAVFLDPKLFEAQRVLGEYYMSIAGGDAKLINKATGKFNYAADLAPDDVPSLRASAFAMARAGKHEVALELFRKLVTRRAWDLEARYQLGAAMWHVGDVASAEQQLEQVTAKRPDHLQARRVLVLIHASRNDTQRLIRELESIALVAPLDLEVKSDLASAYGAVGAWSKAVVALEAIAAQRPSDLALLIRLGDAHRRGGNLDVALQTYQRAARVAPESSLPGFAAAQMLFDAGRAGEAVRQYQLLQKHTGADLAAAEHALGVLAMRAGKADEAAWYLRRAVRAAPRLLASRRALVAAEILRKDAVAALAHVEPALAGWPDDPTLHYLAGLAHALAGDQELAREHLTRAVRLAPGMAAATTALTTLAGGVPALELEPELVRPWGDGEALQHALERYEQAASALAATRVRYQALVLEVLGILGQGPRARPKAAVVRTCPAGRIAPLWDQAQQELQRYTWTGVELETAYRFLARHDEVGLSASLLPNSRTAVAQAKKRFRTALADMGELRAEWTRGLGPELRSVGCTDKLLQAAVADPLRYRVIAEDRPEPIPPRQPPRPRPRTTFFVDNTRCTDPVDVWIDGTHIGQVAPGRRGALVADGGERALCLLLPGGAQCGDRGTVRQVYLHDGWSTTLHCPK